MSSYLQVFFDNHGCIYQTLKERLKEAAKQRIRRMMAHHKNAKLNVPDFVKQAWATRGQDEMATMLMNANWQKARPA